MGAGCGGGLRRAGLTRPPSSLDLGREGKSLSRAAPPSAAPARRGPGGGGTHGLQLLQPVLHPGAQAPEAGERVRSARVPGELPEVATGPGRAGSWRRRWAAAAAG